MRHLFTALPTMFCTSAEVPGNLLGILGVPSQTFLTVGTTGNVALSFTGEGSPICSKSTYVACRPG